MKYQSFQSFYEQDLIGIIREFEARRKTLKKPRVVWLSILWLVALGIGFWIYHSSFFSPVFFMIIAMALVFFSVKILQTPSLFRENFKQQVISKVMQQVDESLVYTPRGYLTLSQFLQSKIFHPSAINRYHSEDYAKGKIKETEFSFAEIVAKRESGSGKNRKTHHVFQGLYFFADFHKHFLYDTYVLPDVAEAGFGFLGRKLQKWNMNRPPLVQMEDTRFEKEFVVYSQDQTEARYILSSLMMENIMKLRKQVGRGVALSFVGSKVHITIPMHGKWLEPNFWGSLVQTDQLESYHDTLKEVVGMVELLNLNRRIWTKK